jgi:hypothetical protein
LFVFKDDKGAPLIVATVASDELQVTVSVRSCLVLSEYMPVAVSDRAVLFAIAGLVGVIEIAVSEDPLEESTVLTPPPHPAIPMTNNDAKRMKQILFFSI